MGYIPTHGQVLTFLNDEKLRNGNLAYLNQQGGPSSATVAFSSTPDLDIVFGTSDGSRKFRLLHTDRRVAFHVTDELSRHSVQLEGMATELTHLEMETFEDAHYAKLGDSSRRFRHLAGQHFFVIHTNWLRFSDCLKDPWTTTVLIGGK